MTKKKNFHGAGGKGGLVRQMAFFYRSRPGGTRTGFPKPANPQARGDLQKKAPASAANAGGGRVDTSDETASTPYYTKEPGEIQT